MTLDRHELDGIPRITARVLPTEEFEVLLVNAGYHKVGSAPARGNRIKVWWQHPIHRRIESIYSSDGQVAITAYHVGD